MSLAEELFDKTAVRMKVEYTRNNTADSPYNKITFDFTYHLQCCKKVFVAFLILFFYITQR